MKHSATHSATHSVKHGATLFALSLFIAGCLPSSCAREESRDLFASDSLSRSIAAAFPVDTLRAHFTTPEQKPLFKYPRTVAFQADGKLIVTDAEANEVIRLTGNGDVDQRLDLGPLVGDDTIPYLAGTSGDTLILFLAGTNHIVGLLDSTLAFNFPIAPEDAGRQLRYAAADDRGIWLKYADPDAGAAIVTYNATGERIGQRQLAGPYWSHAGPLRRISDQTVSVRGYLPAVSLIRDGVAEVDSLRFVGFDSPMLARMRSFALGQTKSPPLLIASLAADDGRYFIVNVRPGWLRIDVYRSNGQLEAILTEPDPGFNKSFYPTDIAVNFRDDEYLIAVTVAKPRPVVRVYGWKPR